MLCNEMDSYINLQRRRRMDHFRDLLAPLVKPIDILDVGGTERFWENMGFAGDYEYKITILNIEPIYTHYSNISSTVGDGRSIPFPQQSFDVVFSNSTIEHLTSHHDQAAMANEILRVGRHYFVQTPNRYFLNDPHFYRVPFFQFLPIPVRYLFLRYVDLGWGKRMIDPEEAHKAAISTRLLSKSELQEFFPTATILRETWCGFTYSLIAQRFSQ